MFDNPTIKAVTAISAAAASGALAATYLLSSNAYKGKQALLPQPKKWIRVGEVSELVIYPIKSCKQVNVDQVTATKIGMKASEYLRDRIFVVVMSDGVFRTQRQLPRMALIGVSIAGNELTLTAPGTESVTITIPEYSEDLVRSCKIFDDVVKTSLDCGDQVGQWLSDFLQVPGLRLYFHQGDVTQRTMVPLQKKFPMFVPTDKGSYQDQTSYMLIAEESLAKLNEVLDSPVSVRNFRPSIIIKGVPEPFSEDMWAYVRIGDENGPVFKASKPCTRCKLTTVDPDKGEFDELGEPLRTLHKLKRSYGDDKVNELCKNFAVLGLQMGLYQPGNNVRVGDPVYAAVL